MEEYTDISVTMHTQRSTVRQTIRHNTCTSLTASITYIITYSHSHLLAIRVQLLFIQYLYCLPPNLCHRWIHENMEFGPTKLHMSILQCHPKVWGADRQKEKTPTTQIRNVLYVRSGASTVSDSTTRLSQIPIRPRIWKNGYQLYEKYQGI